MSELSMAPQRLDLDLMRGMKTHLNIDLTSNNTPVDITTSEVRFTAREYLGGEIRFQRRILAGTHTDPINGLTALEIAADDIVDSTFDTLCWVYEIRVIAQDTSETVYLYGDLEVLPAVGGEVTP